MDNVQHVKHKLQTVVNVYSQELRLHVKNVLLEITFHQHQHLVLLLVLLKNML